MWGCDSVVRSVSNAGLVSIGGTGAAAVGTLMENQYCRSCSWEEVANPISSLLTWKSKKNFKWIERIQTKDTLGWFAPAAAYKIFKFNGLRS